MFDNEDRMYLTDDERNDLGMNVPEVQYDGVSTLEIRTPDALKRHFIERASPMIDQMIDAALGTGEMKATNIMARDEVWDLLKGIIKEAENPVPLLNLKGGNIEEQIDIILTKVSTGEINFEQAKRYMELVSSGFNIQKLPELLKKLDALENMQ